MSFRREKFVPKGGPDGGDGGDGGDVVLLADPDMRDLSAFRFRRHLRGQRGVHGQGGGKTGGNGEHAIVHVPLGTQVYDASGEVPIADLAHARARVVIARGGRGGRGNRRFTTAVRQAPRTAEVGEEGESAELELRLKMVCDAALLGFPNAGKSSLLRRISNATPKVADYPFTTLAPQLGTVELDDLRQLTVADVPGLLEGASDGVGLGHAFLAHLERAYALVHVVAIDPEAGDPLADCRKRYAAIYGELAKHGGGLADRPQIVVLNKLDLVDEAEGAALVRAFADAVVKGDLPPDAGGRARRARRALRPRSLVCHRRRRRRPARRARARARRSPRRGAGRHRRGRARRLPALSPEGAPAHLPPRARRRHRAHRGPRGRGARRQARPLDAGGRARAVGRARPPRRDRGAAARRRQAGLRGRDRRRALRVLAPARGGPRRRLRRRRGGRLEW